jgi:hypothetical protein
MTMTEKHCGTCALFGSAEAAKSTCVRCLNGNAYEEWRPTKSANDTQVAGDHYKSKAIQPWDYIVSNELGYLEGNVVKYVSRWKDKGGIDDLRKARHYLDKLIEVNTPK